MPPHTPATRREVEATLRCAPPRPVPLFLPAIYEHKAWFIGSNPSAISRDADLLTRGMGPLGRGLVLNILDELARLGTH